MTVSEEIVEINLFVWIQCCTYVNRGFLLIKIGFYESSMLQFVYYVNNFVGRFFFFFLLITIFFFTVKKNGQKM